MDYNKIASIFIQESINKFPSTILAVYLMGSFARGDYLPSYSDMDFYIIISNNSNKNEVKNWLKNLGKSFKKTHGVEIDPVIVKRSEIAKPNRDAYMASKEGKLLFGDDMLSTIAPIQPLLLKDTAKDAVQWWLDLVKGPIPANQDVQELARGLTDVVLQIAREALLAKGSYISDKGKVAEKFNEVFTDFRLKDVVREASDLRKDWASVKNDEERLKLWVVHTEPFFKVFKDYIKLHPL